MDFLLFFLRREVDEYLNDSKIDRISRKPQRPFILFVVGVVQCPNWFTQIQNCIRHLFPWQDASVSATYCLFLICKSLLLSSVAFVCVCASALQICIVRIQANCFFFSASFKSFIFHFPMNGLCNIYLEIKAMLMVVVNAFESILFHTYYIWIFYINHNVLGYKFLFNAATKHVCAIGNYPTIDRSIEQVVTFLLLL